MRRLVNMPRKKKQEKKVEEKKDDRPECNNCDSKKRMSMRQVDTDRDGRIVADIYECGKCHSWTRILRKETKQDEINRLRKRLAQLEE